MGIHKGGKQSDSVRKYPYSKAKVIQLCKEKPTVWCPGWIGSN